MGGRPAEGWLPHEHFVQHTAKRVDVAPGGDLALARRLLGAHIVRRADGKPGPRQASAGGRCHRERHAEIGHQCLAIVKQDVLRLDVPVDHAVAMRIVEGARDSSRDLQGVLDWKLLLAAQPVA